MKNKVIAMMLVLATIMTTIPVSSVNAFDAECNFKYTDNGLNNDFMNYEEPKSEVTFNYTEKEKLFGHSNAIISVLSDDKNSNDLVVSRADLDKVIQETKGKYVDICSKVVTPDAKGFTVSGINIVQVPIKALKSRESLRVYTSDRVITDYTCKYDDEGNLIIKLPKLESGSYYMTDKTNKKEIDNALLEYVKKDIYLTKGKKQDLATKFKQNASKITLKSSNSKNVSVKGTTVTMKKGDATVTMKIALKDGGTKTIKVKIHKTLGSGTRVFDRNNQWNNLPENKKGGCK